MFVATLALATLSLVVTAAAYWAVFRKVGAASSPSLAHDPGETLPDTDRLPLPGVTILKPLKGADDELYENLLAFAHLDYPAYEVLCAAEDADDESLEIAGRVQREHPNLAMGVFTGTEPDPSNPKVRILKFLADRAKYDWILISDSNVRPGPDYLAAIMQCQGRTKASLVHNVLGGSGEQSLGAILENLQMNSWVVGAVCLADAAGHPCVIGKSMLLRRSELDALGGFDAVANVLAEDYVLGQMFARSGRRVELSPYVLPTLSSQRSVDCYLNRHIRWGQLRRHLSFPGFVGELLFNPTPWLLATMPLASSWEAKLAALAGLLAKLVGDALVARRLRGSPLPLRQLLCLPVKDILTLGMWLCSAVKTRVLWRGNQLRIGAGTRLMPPEGRSRSNPAFSGPALGLLDDPGRSEPVL